MKVLTDTTIAEHGNSSNWNYGERQLELIRDECLHQLFENSADLYPDHIAVVCDGKMVTYSELEAYSNQVARYIRTIGVKRGDRVAILLERSFEQYVCMLAIMKAGAAYVPLDPGYPEDRVHYILEDCGIETVLTTEDIAAQYQLTCNVALLDLHASLIAEQSTRRFMSEEIGTQSDDLSYVIYTSGTTGRPKGVMIEHRNSCHLVRASQTIYQVQPEDRVYQGFTIAFDASIEEIWMAFAHGAALVVGTRRMQQAGLDLPKLLTEAGVTVLSCVPTLLSMWEEDIPTLRLLIVGGEECPPSLVQSWSIPGRRMMNTYGPTEATVIATYTECTPDQPITIGRPLPNYTVYILDEEMNAVPTGKEGELCIGGVGLARGYVNREDLTQEKFIANPFVTSPYDSQRLYRTGDLVRFNQGGKIEFLGRIDSQVKIRGYRVELSEIETIIASVSGVRNAVVHVHEQTPGLQVLVGYVVPEEGVTLDIAAIYHILRDRLPAYMVPTYIEVLAELPTLISGKVDRKSLPKPTGEYTPRDTEYIAPSTECEQKIACVWEEVFKREAISITDHFFHDLGGHSLFAALVISKLREDEATAGLAVSDLYAHPTIESLARFVGEEQEKKKEKHTKRYETAFERVSNGVYNLCGLAQGFGVYLLYFLISLPFFFIYEWITRSGTEWDIRDIAMVTLAGLALYYPAMLVLSVVAKWLLIGRYKEGEYRLWGSYYFRWWLVRRIQALVPVHFLVGTPWIAWYYRLMGAKVGKNCYIGTQHLHSFDVIQIGDDCSIGLDAQMLGYTVENGRLIIRKIEIGNGCYVGSHAVISPGVVMKDEAQLSDQSLASFGDTIDVKERWIGSPATKTLVKDEDLEKSLLSRENPSSAVRFMLGISYVVGMILLMVVPTLASLPSIFVMKRLFMSIGYWALLLAPISGCLFVLTLSLGIAVLKRFVLGNVPAGQYSIYSFFYVRKWFVDKLLYMSLLLTNSLYATLYAAPFLRLLGAKIGKTVEVSTVTHISPDLLSIGEGSFVADAVCLGTPKIFMGTIHITDTRIGSRTFIGNSAHIEGGKEIGSNCLIGVLSVPPDERKTEDGTSWLGSPAMFLPRRDINTCFSETETYKPTTSLYVKRYVIEFFRVTLPASFTIWMISMMWWIAGKIEAYMSMPALLFVFPLVMAVAALAATLLVVITKQVLIGQYKPTAKPLWSSFVWRSELVTALYENVSVPFLIANLFGTPFLRYALGLFGVKMGKRVFMESSYISEFDLVHVGDGAAVNMNSTMQTHLFEDRVMKMSDLIIGENCSVGNGSVVLYDTKMNPGSALGNLSLIMKGETLPASTYWEGAPAKYRG
ncbi:non-ribosomal peptide synthetase-like protein [Aneurinibacillus soli]|uniref:Linear gramicidin synthase subunit D n=1 Tax=Aneurinibacillus soli TaxID=1500254 RepID=A0A0U5BE48_9BACL|nr:Pls/PosA family non-ribosomal peptide synthetase [Aneurinibacillus soli]PYE61623.1 non-ribosomal peptide synthetase-like protein [Aneurinibacillus soli]BAU28519.1 Linear gramicidin synthase subunit D [Aneurinibacillus soli]